jgi:hypothetical protein
MLGLQIWRSRGSWIWWVASAGVGAFPEAGETLLRHVFRDLVRSSTPFVLASRPYLDFPWCREFDMDSVAGGSSLLAIALGLEESALKSGLESMSAVPCLAPTQSAGPWVIRMGWDGTWTGFHSLVRCIQRVARLLTRFATRSRRKRLVGA